MSQQEFYKLYIPALTKALECENEWEQFNIKGPEHFMNLSNEAQREIEIYLDEVAGQDTFLDKVAYYFDAKSHGFSDIDGVKLDKIKSYLNTKIQEYKTKYEI